MIDPKILDDLASKLSRTLPDGIKNLQEDMEHNLKAVLQSAFSRMDLVSREEFEVQAALLARTREKLKALEHRIIELEQALDPKKE